MARTRALHGGRADRKTHVITYKDHQTQLPLFLEATDADVPSLQTLGLEPPDAPEPAPEPVDTI